MLVIINNVAIIILKLILCALLANVAENISYAGEYYALSFMHIVSAPIFSMDFASFTK